MAKVYATRHVIKLGPFSGMPSTVSAWARSVLPKSETPTLTEAQSGASTSTGNRPTSCRDPLTIQFAFGTSTRVRILGSLFNKLMYHRVE